MKALPNASAVVRGRHGSSRLRRGPKFAVAAFAISVTVGLVVLSHASAAPPTTIDLGTAASASVLANSGVTNSGNSLLDHDVDSATGAIAGFPPGVTAGTLHLGDTTALDAQTDLSSAYNTAATETPTGDVTGIDLGGKTLTPGVYNATASMSLTGTLPLTLNGPSDAVFVFQAGTTLITGANASVVLMGGVQACNVYWQVGTSATVDASTAFSGNILAADSITLNSGASLDGRALAETAR